jgi:hypothetical protein
MKCRSFRVVENVSKINSPALSGMFGIAENPLYHQEKAVSTNHKGKLINNPIGSPQS